MCFIMNSVQMKQQLGRKTPPDIQLLEMNWNHDAQQVYRMPSEQKLSAVNPAT